MVSKHDGGCKRDVRVVWEHCVLVMLYLLEIQILPLENLFLQSSKHSKQQPNTWLNIQGLLRVERCTVPAAVVAYLNNNVS